MADNSSKTTKPNKPKNDLIAMLTADVNNPTDNKGIDKIPVNLLIPYVNHPFKLYEGDRLSDMVRSIKELGILLPVIVRPSNSDDEVYEILSGHNRVNAAKIAGLYEIPAIVKYGLDDDEAQLIVTETNLVQRSFSDLSHSERAVALKCHMDAISKQGKRNDLINEIKNLANADKTEDSDIGGLKDHRLKSRDKTAEKYGLDPRSVSRYIRLCEVNKSLLDRVDNEEIGLYAAVSISYLSANEQNDLNNILDETSYKVDMKKAESMRSLSENKKLTCETIKQILSGQLYKKHKPKSLPPLKIKHKIYSKYFTADTPKNEIELTIEKALAEYFQAHKLS